MTSPFDYINSISYTKEDLMENPDGEKDYSPWMINKGLSQFIDTIEHANRMNMNHHLDKLLQWDYLINSVRPRKRYSKWAKKKDDGDLELIMQCYGININKAREAKSILTPSQIKDMKDKLSTGG